MVDLLRKYKSLYSSTSNSYGTGTGVTITPGSVVGLPTDTEITLTFDRVNSSGTPTPSLNERIVGSVSAGNFVVRASTGRGFDGTTEQAHTSPVVEMIWNAKDWNDLIVWATTEHAQDGTHKKVTGLTNNTPIEQKNAAAVSKYLIGRNSSDQTYLYDANNNELLIFDTVASAVNYAKILASATGNQVVFQALGDDTDILLELKGKGAKGVRIVDLVPKVVALTDAATIATNAALGNYFTVTITDNRAFGVPTNPTDGQVITFEIKQDGTGSRIPTWSSSAGGFSFGAVSAPTLSTTAAKVDLVGFRYSATVGKWLYLGSQLGY